MFSLMHAVRIRLGEAGVGPHKLRLLRVEEVNMWSHNRNSVVLPPADHG